MLLLGLLHAFSVVIGPKVCGLECYKINIDLAQTKQVHSGVEFEFIHQPSLTGLTSLNETLKFGEASLKLTFYHKETEEEKQKTGIIIHFVEAECLFSLAHCVYMYFILLSGL